MNNEIVKKIKNEVDVEKILMSAMKTPGVKINRAKFLRKELIKYCKEDVIEEAIQGNPAKAGIPVEIINSISQQVINYETTKVTGLSVAASLPGGGAAVGAALADITSYFAFVLRVVQELAYLYGFEQFEFNEDDLDSESMQFILLFMGVMFSVQGASEVLKKLSEAFSRKIAKDMAKKALTKGMIYPIVKRVLKSLGVKITKQVFADAVASAVPIAGGALSGGLTYAAFRPCCMRLRKNLRATKLCDPNFYKETMDAEFKENN